jgi:succinate dehydrogenase / fumarate reductase, membrane anchor subunit
MTAAATAEPAASSPPADEPGWPTYLVRTTGLLLFLLLLAHVLWLFIVHDIEAENIQTFTERWNNPLWRAVDWGVVVLGLVHGALGLRPVIASSRMGANARGAVLAVLYGVVGVLVATTTFVAFTFRFL